MKRYKIVTYKLDTVKRNIRAKQEAIDLAKCLELDLKIERSFFVYVDKWYTVLFYISILARILYAPIYFIGVILLMLARIVLALAYLLILEFKASANVLKFMFIWRQ